MAKKSTVEHDPEISAISTVYKALRELNPDAHARVLHYVAGKLKIDIRKLREATVSNEEGAETESEATSPQLGKASEVIDDGLEGVSPVAKRWMIRNSLQAKPIATIFSLGVDEIDLVAKTVPGTSKKDRMHNVLLLKGIAAYLGTGIPHFTHEQLKEACMHYQAYDAANFAAYMKSFSGEASGDKRTGYTLTPRGLSSGTELLREILQPAAAHA
jgi:hypothetical protein